MSSPPVSPRCLTDARDDGEELAQPGLDRTLSSQAISAGAPSNDAWLLPLLVDNLAGGDGSYALIGAWMWLRTSVIAGKRVIAFDGTAPGPRRSARRLHRRTQVGRGRNCDEAQQMAYRPRTSEGPQHEKPATHEQSGRNEWSKQDRIDPYS
ncbi:hypothetical protein Ntsu_17120 [Nocardia sp. IFM 10818]